MGGKQSKLKKELETLKAEAAATTAKHHQDVETLRNEKRMLEFKLQALQEMTARAQVEAETATALAIESEEKVKALKWELVRRVSVPTSPVPPVVTVSTSSTSRETSTASVPRVPVSWKLKDGVVLHRSNTTLTPSSRPKPERSLSHDVVKTPPVVAHNVEQKPLSKSVVGGTLGAKTRSNNQGDGCPVAPLPTVTPVATAITTTAMSDVDKFAPVKRRSSTKDTIVTMAMEVKTTASKPVDYDLRQSGDESDRDSDRRSGQAPSKRDGVNRGVWAATKEHTPLESKTDDVLALSDDEDEG